MKKVVMFLVFVLLISTVCFATNSFYDLSSSHWAYDTIIKMKNAGILNGYEDGSFKPDQEVTREEFTQMMLKITKTTSLDIDKIQNYFDVSSERWSYKAVQAFGSSIKESSDGYVYFYPTRQIQRQEVAKIVSDYYGLDNNNLDSRDNLISKFNVRDSYSIDLEYADAVYNVYENGFMKGMSETEFSPTTSLTRAQAATLLSRIDEQMSTQTTPEPVETPVRVTPRPTETPVSENIDLDMEFLHLENKKSNMIYSPLSIKYALKMLSDGADNNTKKEIDDLVAHYTLAKYNSSEHLSLANGVFILDSYKDKILDSYIDTLRKNYNAEVKYDSFESASTMNKWSQEKTLSLIKNMIKDSDLQDNLRMVLINSLAIDMEWQHKFGRENTYGQDFTKDDGSVVNAEMMHASSEYKGEYVDESFGYYLDDDVQVYSRQLKEYDGERLEFVAIMPKTERLTDYTADLSKNDIDDLLGKIEHINTKPLTVPVRKVNLTIPMFDFEYDLDLVNDLKALGMHDAFTRAANLSKMTGNLDLYVSNAMHKAKIEFSEEGIKAAATTAFFIAAKSAFIMPQETENINIVFDKPFLFLIRDTITNELWFVGTMYEPNLHK